MSFDPAATPPADPAARQPDDPARPDATRTSEPAPGDSARDSDAERARGGMGGYLDPGLPLDPKAGAGEGGYSSAKPLLMTGAAGPEVAELGHLLAEHGYGNAISEGTADAPPILDDDLMRTVVDFQRSNGIDPWQREGEDATAPPLLRRNVHTGIVDARTWEALLGEPAIVTREGAR